MRQSLTHPYPPVFDENSRILILGSFPSVKSRQEGFYYAHPRNRFYPVLAGILRCGIPQTVQEKKEMLLKYRIALWDVIASCEIQGSDDASIKNAKANDISRILLNADIRAVFTNGAAAHTLYMKKIFPQNGTEAVRLPSTSPANAARTVDSLILEWGEAILPFLSSQAAH